MDSAALVPSSVQRVDPNLPPPWENLTQVSEGWVRVNLETGLKQRAKAIDYQPT